MRPRLLQDKLWAVQNLRDKLIKAGLVSKEQAERLDRPKSDGRSRPAPPEKTVSAPRPPSPPEKVKDGSAAAQRLNSLKQRQLDTRLRELVHLSQVAIEPGDRPFYFQTRKGKLRRLELSDAQAKLLENGALAVVERPEPASIEHSLVPSNTAEEIFALSAKSVRFFARPNAPIGCALDSGEEDVAPSPRGKGS